MIKFVAAADRELTLRDMESLSVIEMGGETRYIVARLISTTGRVLVIDVNTGIAYDQSPSALVTKFLGLIRPAN